MHIEDYPLQLEWFCVRVHPRIVLLCELPSRIVPQLVGTTTTLREVTWRILRADEIKRPWHVRGMVDKSGYSFGAIFEVTGGEN